VPHPLAVCTNASAPKALVNVTSDYDFRRYSAVLSIKLQGLWRVP
jgi:hypothetical protein